MTLLYFLLYAQPLLSLEFKKKKEGRPRFVNLAGLKQNKNY